MQEPIEACLHGQRLCVAKLQDRLVNFIYDVIDPHAVLYGGTAIWRCYSGNRFSEDIDIYLSRDIDFEKVDFGRHGLSVKWRDPDDKFRIKLSDGVCDVSLDSKVVDMYGSSIAKQYETVNGMYRVVYTFRPEELLVRKMEAYAGRRYVRDMYDIFHLTNFVDRNDYYVRDSLGKFLDKIKSPSDPAILSTLIYKGDSSLTYDRIVDYLKRWLDEVRR
jgi:predicted nucleotidyltransferase component of viral defense system